jgi:3-oxoacyl-[acyl-carrier protein] reductase
MDKPLAGRVALVTGATRLRGIGAAIAHALAEDGASLLLHVYRPYDAAQPWGVGADEPERLAAELAARALVETRELDLALPDSTRALVGHAVARFGRLDILVNNAACSEMGDLARLDAAQLDRHYAVNLRAPALLCREFARVQRGPGGCIVNLSSGQGLGPMPEEIAYAATKGGLEALTSSLAPWLAARGIRIFAVDPGPTDTGWMSDAQRAELARLSQDGRVGTPDDVARVVRALVKGDARDASGQVVRVRGVNRAAEER